MTEASLAAGLDDIFTVKPGVGGAFDAVIPDAETGRPFGGHLIGLAIRAAASTVDGTVSPVPHALHARFLRAGRAGEPVRLTVTPVHDGRTIAVRQLTAVQGTRTLLTAELSFHDDAREERWQAPGHPLRVPDRAVFSPLAGVRALAPFEIRAEHEHVRGSAARLHPFWARLREPEPDRDPVLDACALAVLTDVGVTASARRPGSPLRVQRAAVTLDHALWLHGAFRAEEWLQVAVRRWSTPGAGEWSGVKARARTARSSPASSRRCCCACRGIPREVGPAPRRARPARAAQLPDVPLRS